MQANENLEVAGFTFSTQKVMKKSVTPERFNALHFSHLALPRFDATLLPMGNIGTAETTGFSV
jgi:hypothetical protein